MAAFKPVSITYCDYVTQDANGRFILLGVAHEELRFPTQPSILPPIFLVVMIKPQAKQFRYAVDFDAPDGSRIMRLTASCEIEGEYPPRHFISTNLQSPAIPFPGEGEYVAQIRDENMHVVFRQPLYIAVGPTFQPKLNFEGSMELGEKYAQPTVKH